MVRIASCSALGAAVRQERRQRRLTQADLAAIAGVSRQWLSQLENGKGSVETAKVLAVLSALGLYLSVERSPPAGHRPTAEDVLAAHVGP